MSMEYWPPGQGGPRGTVVGATAWGRSDKSNRTWGYTRNEEDTVRRAAALAALAVLAIAPAAASAAGTGAVHPGVHDVHRRRPVHRELHLPERFRHLHRPGRALLRHRRRDRHQRLRRGHAAARHAGRGRRRDPARHARLQLVGRDAANGETNADACEYNDFALVRLDPADVANVNPTVPGFGGPHGLGGSSAMLGDDVYSYGNSGAARRRHQAQPEAGRCRPGRGQRLEPDRLHGHAGHPR